MTVPPGGIVVEYDLSDPTDPTRNASVVNGPVVYPWSAWSARSAWPGHPAILPPLPRATKSEALATAPFAEQPSQPAHSYRAEQSYQERQPYPGTGSHAEAARPLPKRPVANTAREAHRRDMRSERKLTSRSAHPQVRPMRTAQRPSSAAALEYREWPASFDDWMMDIVRRRALRLNSGARRRGVQGTVRAVDLAHILDRSADPQGRWRCALCHNVVTLDELSFDHVIALADGGEHAAYNLVPAHRKCNEIKGSEKAQYRAEATERWLTEWASPDRSKALHANGARSANARNHLGYGARSTEPTQRYA